MTAASSRKIGPVLATFVVANNMIGSGFFLLPSSLAQSGSVTVLSWLLGTALAIALGAAFARLARDYPRLESPDDYVRPALGRDMGFLATTLYWGSSWIGNNAIAVAAFGYLLMCITSIGAHLGWNLAGFDGLGVQLAGQVLLIWAMYALNLLGPRSIARFQSACVVIGLAPIAVVLVAGWGYFDAALFDAAWNTTGADWNVATPGEAPQPRSDFTVVLASLAPVFWAFVGLETGAMVAGVVRDPDRNVPRATIAGIVLAGAVYLVASVLVMGIVPARELAVSSAPFALVAGRMFEAWWVVPLIAGAAALKATGTLGGWMLVSGESGARAAQRGYLPAIFGRLRGNGAAGWGLMLVSLGMTAIAFLTLAPTAAAQFGVIIGVVVLLVVLAYVAAGLSLLVGTRERPPGWRERALGSAALLACGLLIFTSPWKTIAGAFAVAFLAWLAFRLFAPRRAA